MSTRRSADAHALSDEGLPLPLGGRARCLALSCAVRGARCGKRAPPGVGARPQSGWVGGGGAGPGSLRPPPPGGSGQKNLPCAGTCPVKSRRGWLRAVGSVAGTVSPGRGGGVSGPPQGVPPSQCRAVPAAKPSCWEPVGQPVRMYRTTCCVCVTDAFHHCGKCPWILRSCSNSQVGENAVLFVQAWIKEHQRCVSETPSPRRRPVPVTATFRSACCAV